MPTFGVNIRRSKGAVDPIFLTVPLNSVTQIYDYMCQKVWYKPYPTGLPRAALRGVRGGTEELGF
jgi:hypothetical protein